jgi:hypothetical protein
MEQHIGNREAVLVGSIPAAGAPLGGEFGGVGWGVVWFGTVWSGLVRFGKGSYGACPQRRKWMEYNFRLIGVSSILFHADDVMQGDELKAWRNDSEHKSISVAGDDRSPPWTWMSYLHHDGEHLAIPQECLMTALRNAAAKIPLKGQTTFKSLSQSGLLIMSEYCKFTTEGRQIAMADILKFRDRPFVEHVDKVRKLGFNLSVKRAKPDGAKGRHVRVRPEFKSWQVEGVIAVNDPAITDKILVEMYGIAGRKSGLLDWRPSAPKSPGPHGMFEAELRLHKAGRKSA